MLGCVILMACRRWIFTWQGISPRDNPVKGAGWAQLAFPRPLVEGV